MLELFRIAGRIDLEGGKETDGLLDSIDRRGKRATESIGGFVRGVGKVAAGIGLFKALNSAVNAVKNSLDGAISRYDTLNNFPRVLQQMGFDAEASQDAINKLSDGIQGLPTTLDDVAQNAQRIAIMTGDLDGAVDTTLALNNAFIASGSSSADASRGLEQYVQMLSRGEVDLESWRTLQETMGVALNDTAKAFGFAGKSAQRDLYDALKSGEITFDEFNEKLIELNNQTGGFAERALIASGGIRTAFTNMKTAIVRGTTSIIESIDNVLKDTPLESIENIIANAGKRFNAVLTRIAELIPVVVESLRGWYNANKETFEGIWQTIQTVLSQVIEFLQNAWDVIRTFWEEHGQEILDNAKVVFTEIWETIQTVFTEIREFIEKILGYIVPWIQEKLEVLKEFWDENGEQIMQAVQNAFEFIRDTIQFVMDLVSGIIDGAWEGIKQIFDSAVGIIMGIIKTFTGLFTGDWEKMSEGIEEIWKNLWGAIKGAVDGAWGMLSGAFGALWDKIAGWFEDLWDDAKGWGKDLIQGFWNGIRSMGTWIKDKVGGFIKDKIPGPIKKVLKIASPSKLTEEYGENTGEGLLIGLENMGKKISKVAEQMAFSAANPVQQVAQVGASTYENTQSIKTQPVTNVFADMFRGMFEGANFNVKNEQDIEYLARRLGEYMKENMRRVGVVSVR